MNRPGPPTPQHRSSTDTPGPTPARCASARISLARMKLSCPTNSCRGRLGMAAASLLTMRTVQTRPVPGLGPADWVTLTRASLAAVIAALVVQPPVPVALLVSLSAVALVLDAVDGWVARRTSTSERGARWDGEVDAFLI